MFQGPKILLLPVCEPNFVSIFTPLQPGDSDSEKAKISASVAVGAPVVLVVGILLDIPHLGVFPGLGDEDGQSLLGHYLISVRNFIFRQEKHAPVPQVEGERVEPELVQKEVGSSGVGFGRIPEVVPEGTRRKIDRFLSLALLQYRGDHQTRAEHELEAFFVGPPVLLEFVDERSRYRSPQL